MSNPNFFLGIGRTVVRWLGKFFATEPDPAKEKFLSKMASSSSPRPEEFEALLTLLHVGAVEIQYQQAPKFLYLLNFSAKDRPALKRVALFDLPTNNADRKPLHLLPGNSGELWTIDHGLCFNSRFALRTFIWELDGQPIPENLLDDVAGFRRRLDSDHQMLAALNALMAPPEMAALRRRPP